MSMSSANAASAANSHITGRILVKETREGVGDVLVELFDFDAWADPEAGEASGGATDPVGILRDPLKAFGGGG